MILLLLIASFSADNNSFLEEFRFYHTIVLQEVHWFRIPEQVKPFVVNYTVFLFLSSHLKSFL
jgi:hypothetical protein